MKRKREFIAALLALAVLGALTGREFPVAGLVALMVAVAVYVAFNLRRAWKGLSEWKTAGAGERYGAVAVVILCVLLVGMAVTGRPDYFPVLLLFCADLLVK